MENNSTVTQEQPQYNRSKWWQIMLFTFNNTSTNIYLFSYAFISYYATGVIGLAVVLVSSLLGGIRFFDGAIDPAIGAFIDRLDTRFGKYRPIMLVGNIVTALSFVILFSIHTAPENLQIVILIISLLIHKIGYSLQASVTKAGQTVLTNDPKQRPLFTAFDGVFNIGVFTGGQIFISNVLVPRNGGFTESFFYELQTVAIVVSAVLAILAIIGIWEKDTTEYYGMGEDTVETKGFVDYWKVIKRHRPFQLFVVSAAADKLGVTVIGDAVLIVMLFGIYLGNYALSGTVSALSIIPDLIITFFCTWLAQRVGLKKSFMTSIGAALVSFLGIGALLLTLNDPASTFSTMNFTVILFIILYSAARSFSRTPTTLAIPMTADISDYETAKSGRYVAGMIGTIFSFIDSIAASLGPVIIGWVSAAMGFAEAYPTVETAFSPEIKAGTLFLISIFPAAMMLISFVAMKFYPLDAEKMEEVQQQITARRQASREKKELAREDQI